ncbi:GNAT family N-acetyltransferase [Crossiella sp. CA198]|uniref:GNAT family N-acetyltransferase n=1 Tax=Crossiella sp. CA198 TaxID=3455607 RepID=UPI003F8D405B
MAEQDVQVTRNEQANRYEVTVDGVLAGFAEYQLRDGRAHFTHTEVFAEFGGRGLGGVLAADALADTAGRDLEIVPLCPFIARYLTRHPDFAGRVAWPEQA